jgi:hypothetical protein
MLRVRLSDLARMAPGERSGVLMALTAEAHAETTGGRQVLGSRIKEYEVRYELSSADLRRRLAAGEQRETAEIADWLFLLDARDNRVRS